MSAREAILGRIAAAAARPDQPATVEQAPEGVRRRLSKPPVNTQPGLSGSGETAEGDALTRQLIERMESVQMTVARLQTMGEVADAVSWYLESEGIDGEMTVAPALGELDWPSTARVGSASGTEKTSVTSCLAAVAETGSLAMASGVDSPATLNFLPDNHIVVVRESQIVRHLEDVWTRQRTLDVLPRALNLVTGPSRTADIEQTIEIGAHGPRRMHILLVAES